MKRWNTMVLLVAILSGPALAENASWVEKTTLKGDLRYRYEWIDDAGKSDTRTRHRVRARVGLFADVNEDVSVGVQLASGEDDPVSTNQTLGEDFSTKNIGLDLAYINWKLAEGLDVTGGKMKKPFLTVADLIWDGDLNPEGLAANYAFGEDIKFLANAGYFWLEENSASDSNDRMLYTGQAAVQAKLESCSLLAGVGVYAYDNMKGYAPLYDITKGFGNSVVESTDDEGMTSYTYANDYTEFEAFVEIGFKAGKVPVKACGQYVQNDDADAEDTGYLVGVTLGKAKAPGSFQVGYNFRSLEKDAVVGAFADSDFIGGGTNGEGHKFSAKLALKKDVSLAATYFLNSKDPDGKDVDYDRVQIDLACKF